MPKPTGWTNKQKYLAVKACEAVGADRKLILRQLGGHALVKGEPTSTSPKLTQGDFEKFMAHVETYTGDGRLVGKAAHYWEDKFVNGTYGRLLHRARHLSGQLQDAGDPPMKYVAKAVGRDFGDLLYNLDQDELHKAIDAMTAVIRRGAA